MPLFELLFTTVENSVSWPARHWSVLERYHETSAATAQNVEVAFQEIARRALKQEHTEDPMSRWPVAWNLKQRNPWFSGFLLCPVWQSVEPSLNMCLDVSLRLIIFALLLVFYFIRKILPRTSKLDSFNLDVGFSFDLNGEPCLYVVQHLSWQAAPNLCANLVLDMSFFISIII